jgi:hypothetical protein
MKKFYLFGKKITTYAINRWKENKGIIFFNYYTFRIDENKYIISLVVLNFDFTFVVKELPPCPAEEFLGLTGCGKCTHCNDVEERTDGHA